MEKIKLSLVLGAVALATTVLFVGAVRAADGPQTTVAQAIPGVIGDDDPYLWLEQKDGARALAWVNEENAKTLAVLQNDSHYQGLFNGALSVVNNSQRIPYPNYLHGAVYNFWQDQTHVRGIWRRTTIASYRTESPNWTTVLDLDQLATSEKANWVWKGAQCEEPAERYCMLALSNGGEDAITLREFDLDTGRFVPGGFDLPRGKQTVAWDGPNTLIVSREWEPGQVTASGYPYVVKRLRRGQQLSDATEIFRGEKTDQLTSAPGEIHDGAGNTAIVIVRAPTFFTQQLSIETPSGLRRLALPPKISLTGMVAGRLIFALTQAWSSGGASLPNGSLIAVPLKNAVTAPAHLRATLVYAPGPREAVAIAAADGGVSTTKHTAVVSIYHNVNGRELILTPRADGTWSRRQFDLPDNSSTGVADASLHNDDVFLTVTSFLTPTSLYYANASNGSMAEVKRLPEEFDASNDVVDQHEATSKDGTQVPYYVVHPKNMQLDGSNPTVLYAYGGFQVAETPGYSAITGKSWLEHGGVYVLANIRGGGEFGPEWHDAGLTVHRQRIYDDFYAVAQDLVNSKITDSRHLGIEGGSNGGLLMGVEFTQHPEMYNAVSIGVPLLDMMRYEQIEAGASWVDEYGSVSVPEQRAFLRSISPYQNLRAGVSYPEPYIWTTTKDDRVGPEAARKFAAKLSAMKVAYLFYEVTEGGHGAGANLQEAAKTFALQWTYFAMKLMPS
ncbi:MAG TPA: prolyl oligopeptidase family serine peptidase [Candidatus Cybelea sp.]|jgi:prolyl oligopeptidase|nr:prolyl oligopeptidase family serine peptidase [Candidatus Cybelea sp.]